MVFLLKKLVGVNGPCWTQNYSAFSKLWIDSKEHNRSSSWFFTINIWTTSTPWNGFIYFFVIFFIKQLSIRGNLCPFFFKYLIIITSLYKKYSLFLVRTWQLMFLVLKFLVMIITVHHQTSKQSVSFLFPKNIIFLLIMFTY